MSRHLLIQPTRWNAVLAKWQDTTDASAERWMVMENQPVERRFLKAFETREDAEAYRVEQGQEPLNGDAGRFSEYSTEALSAQCRMQARENLDPEYCQFMLAVADRLIASSPAPFAAGGAL